MATTMCEIDGRRPAVATVRIRQNGEEQTIAVCEEHLRELQGQSRGAGRSPFGGRSLFDEFFSDFFGDSAAGADRAGRCMVCGQEDWDLWRVCQNCGVASGGRGNPH